ncbi:MAG: DMT family transporter [Kangiellaceae bacterium]|nr:DMT family transporter [Kangiellaceae bacterium]
MKTRDTLSLIWLAAIWGASFLFMRVAVPEFGAVPLIAIRVTLAGLFLLPLVFWRNKQVELLENILPICVVGIISSAIPFTLIAYSTLYVTAGFASVLNAATPIFSALVAFVWLKQRLNRMGLVGLSVGMVGVILLVKDKIGFSNVEQSETAIAILAGLVSTFAYGFGANYSKRKLTGIDPVTITAGSQLIAAIVLSPLAIYWWPAEMPSMGSWINAILLAILCTALAQIIFFRLIQNIGATNTTTVTFLIPIFGLLWGFLFLGETIPIDTIIAGGIILLGTALANGLIKTKKHHSEP